VTCVKGEVRLNATRPPRRPRFATASPISGNICVWILPDRGRRPNPSRSATESAFTSTAQGNAERCHGGPDLGCGCRRHPASAPCKPALTSTSHGWPRRHCRNVGRRCPVPEIQPTGPNSQNGRPRKPLPRSAASHNLFKPRPARLDGVGRGAEEDGLNNQVVPFKSPAGPPQCPECGGNPRLLCRGTKSSNPSPSSKESSNFRFLSGGRIAREQRVEIRRVARDAMIVAVRVGRAAVVGAAPPPVAGRALGKGALARSRYLGRAHFRTGTAGVRASTLLARPGLADRELDADRRAAARSPPHFRLVLRRA